MHISLECTLYVSLFGFLLCVEFFDAVRFMVANLVTSTQYVLWTEMHRGKVTCMISRAETTLQLLAFPLGLPGFIPALSSIQ